MTVELTIRLFATLKDRAGSERIRVSLPDGPATAGDVLAAVAADYPTLAPALRSTLVAVNRAFAGPETPVVAGDEVAGALGGHHAGDLGYGQHVPLGHVTGDDEAQRCRLHGNPPAGHGHTLGHVLGAHVNHARAAGFVYMGQVITHNYGIIPDH